MGCKSAEGLEKEVGGCAHAVGPDTKTPRLQESASSVPR